MHNPRSLFVSFAFVSILLFSSLKSANGQSFTLSTNDTMIVNINANESKDAEFDFTNNLGGSLSLTWHTIVDSVPSCWTKQVCDYGTCYNVLPAQHVMDSVPHGAFGFLRLTVTLQNYGGTGKIQFFVEETNNPGVGDTVTFLIYGPTNTNCSMIGVPSVQEVKTARVFPNPATEMINFMINLPGAEEATLTVTDLIGNNVIVRDLGTVGAGESMFPVDIRNLASGTYQITFKTSKGSKTKRFAK